MPHRAPGTLYGTITAQHEINLTKQLFCVLVNLQFRVIKCILLFSALFGSGQVLALLMTELY